MGEGKGRGNNLTGGMREMKGYLWKALLILTAALQAHAAYGAVPHHINYQGYLTNNEGEPYNGVRNFVFGIYSSLTGGTPVWTEMHNDVPVTGGLFNVILGSNSPLDLNFSQTFYLGIAVQGEILSPRQQLTSVGQAYNAGDVYNESINPAGISIVSYGPVINSSGEWVGPSAGMPLRMRRIR